MNTNTKRKREKTKNGTAAKSAGSGGDQCIQFAAPSAMVDAIDLLRRDSKAAGLSLTRSHVVRRGMVKYLTGLGYLKRNGVVDSI